MARPAIEEMARELRTWLKDYEHGPNDYPTTIYRILASLPGGDELEEQGAEPIGSVWGWREKDQIQRMLATIEGPRDVQDLIQGLSEEEEESKNIFWRDIPSSATVEQIRQTYVVTLPDGSKAVAYWMGNDATQAQQALDKMVTRKRRPSKSRRAPKRRR